MQWIYFATLSLLLYLLPPPTWGCVASTQFIFFFTDTALASEQLYSNRRFILHGVRMSVLVTAHITTLSKERFIAPFQQYEPMQGFYPAVINQWCFFVTYTQWKYFCIYYTCRRCQVLVPFPKSSQPPRSILEQFLQTDVYSLKIVSELTELCTSRCKYYQIHWHCSTSWPPVSGNVLKSTSIFSSWGFS